MQKFEAEETARTEIPGWILAEFQLLKEPLSTEECSMRRGERRKEQPDHAGFVGYGKDFKFYFKVVRICQKGSGRWAFCHARK